MAANELSQLKELLPFLRDRNPQVRQIALSNLLGQTPKNAPHRSIFLNGLSSGGVKASKENDIIRDLKLLCRDQLTVSHDAFRALVNLSDHPLVISALSDELFLNFLVSYIINQQSVLADLASMLLSNLTSVAAACSIVTSLKVPVVPLPDGKSVYPINSRCATSPSPEPYPDTQAEEALALPLLVDAFIQGAQVEEDKAKRQRKGELHFLASVFGNLSSSTMGRAFFMTPRKSSASSSAMEYPLSKLTAFTEHANTIRRGGVASTIKNCAFHAASHKAMLSAESDSVAVPPSEITAPGVDVLAAILLPLAGPEELDLEEQEKLPDALQLLPPNKKREPDHVLRITHIETLLLLCTTRWGRDYLREKAVYEIVRVMHENETVDKVSEHVERLVQLIKGDEPEGEGDESTDRKSVV